MSTFQPTPQLQPPAPPSPPGRPTPVEAAPAGVTSAPATVIPSLSVLNNRRSELSNQLESAEGRREALAEEMLSASPSLRPGLQARIDVLDQRLVQLEQEIALNGKMRVLAGGEDSEDQDVFTSTGYPNNPFNMSPGNITAVSIVFTLFVMFPIALSFARLIWKRGTRVAAVPVTRDSDLRLERVEQGVDAIAVEVERISEGQRFVTQLMTHGEKPSALPVGQTPAEPLQVSMANTVMAGVMRKNVAG